MKLLYTKIDGWHCDQGEKEGEKKRMEERGQRRKEKTKMKTSSVPLQS